MAMFAPESHTIETYATQLARLREHMSKTVRGKDRIIDQVIVCMLAGGHVLIEDLPGVGKTTLAYALSRSLEGSFGRIQFTSDLLPSDVLGVSIFNRQNEVFEFRKGPIFANIVLADEINRATPKTQSALLEVMDRGRVSMDGQTFATPAPFMVFATQNPVDFEGTFPLPESQMDRFLMRLLMGYAEQDAELEILRNPQLSYDSIDAETIMSLDEIAAMQRDLEQIFVEESVLRYMLAIVQATRTEAEFRAGISTRGAIALKRVTQAYALLHGRGFVKPSDVQSVVKEVFVHRLSTHRQSSDTLEERHLVEDTLGRILEAIPEPV